MLSYSTVFILSRQLPPVPCNFVLSYTVISTSDCKLPGGMGSNYSVRTASAWSRLIIKTYSSNINVWGGKKFSEFLLTFDRVYFAFLYLKFQNYFVRHPSQELIAILPGIILDVRIYLRGIYDFQCWVSIEFMTFINEIGMRIFFEISFRFLTKMQHYSTYRTHMFSMKCIMWYLSFYKWNSFC